MRQIVPLDKLRAIYRRSRTAPPLRIRGFMCRGEGRHSLRLTKSSLSAPVARRFDVRERVPSRSDPFRRVVER